MRIRLQLFLPIAAGLLIGGMFLLAAVLVGDAVRGALADAAAPPLREAAADAATGVLLLWGALAAAAGVGAGILLVRMIVVPLDRVREAAQRMPGPLRPEQGIRVREIQDVARDMSRAAEELRARHDRELRERSELASLVEAVSEGILQLGGDGRVIRTNRAARVLLGLPAQPVGRPIGSLVRHPELRRLLERTAAGEPSDPVEVVLDERRILVTAASQRSGGAVATFVDLTDLRRLEEVRRDFVANASHELKTPLTSIRGYTETLLAGDLPPTERRQFLETIGRNADRLQRIVDDLLDLSRLESGRWQPELQVVDVLDVARAAWLGFAERARAQGVSFQVEPGDGEPLAVADRRGLEQVFANLYDNALRYTPAEGSIRVRAGRSRAGRSPAARATGATDHREAETRAPPASGEWLVVEVADSGAGIPRDALPRIFERFYRVDPARSRAEGGTGLGLSIVKHMVESMGGTVAAHSELGKGTTLRLSLPTRA